MKVSKSLLQTIAVGLVVAGSLNSCTKSEDFTELHSESCTEDCKFNHVKQQTNSRNGIVEWDCGPCGMG